MIGQTISHYKILDKVGEGGMGIVYKAHDTKLDRTVALKFLPHYLGSDPSEKERFFHEARAASALNHPHITTIYEIDQSEGQSFIAMEYVEGKTLKQLIESETPSLKKVLDIAIQVCDGLAAAHEKGVIHRDIKSDNIMVTPKGQAKIMDFGLAKLRGATKLTKEGSTIGTAAYMSPEQASGEEIDQRSDIFSFGVVLYELLSRNLPFRGEHHTAILYSIMNEEPQPVARFNNKVSPELERIVSKVLAKDRDERYQHIDDLLADLRRERKSLEYVKTSTLPQPQQVSKPKKRIVPLFAAVSAVAVLVVLLFVFDPFQLKVSREETAQAAQNSLAVMYFENIPDPEDKDNTGEMLTNLLITALSQVEGLDVISRERLYDIQYELGQGDSRKITPSLATQLAQRVGVETMLLGSILQERPMLAVTSRLIEVRSGKIVSSHRLTEFSSDQMFSLVDSLAFMVKYDLNIRKPLAQKAKSVAEVTSRSLQAYRSYVEGVELFKKFYLSEARAPLERAIELDSDFAMAYFSLSIVNRRLGDNAAERKALQKAWQLSNKVTEKEGLQIRATYVLDIENAP
ncbi:MAG: FlgO family outer membrane protein, partial [Bacteroidota bacterium]